MLGWPLRFQDASFPHKFAWCWSAAEGRHERWIPYGMPRLGSVVEKTVFFLYALDPKTGKRVGPRGTGVLIGLPPDSGELGSSATHYYAVTCQHLAPGGACILRLNTVDGKSRFIKTEADDWKWIPKGDDIAALDVTEYLDRSKDAFSFIPQDLFLTKEFIAQVELGIGEDGFMLGLFAEIPGQRRNLIAARFGNVSLLADDDTPVKQGHEIRRPSHIFDIRSRPGFSGSPVFVYRTPTGDLRSAAHYRPPDRVRVMTEVVQDNPDDEARWNAFVTEQSKNQFIRILGIHTAQYRDTVKAIKTGKTAAEGENLILHGDKLSMPNSMTVIAPAWEILKLLNHPDFKEQRQQREMRMVRKQKPNEPEPESTSDIAHPDADASDTEANPRHLEDFKHLVDVAARKRPQGGQT
jgi:hypothetical protein